ncbi:hypothetical protein QUB47_31455 [Microcoleus sp. AT9_B5]
MLDCHAYHTYDEYLKTYEAQLKAQPAPQVAINFYRDGDLYMFDEVQTALSHEFRRPKVDNLYDVFANIRDREDEHDGGTPETRSAANFQKSPYSC